MSKWYRAFHNIFPPPFFDRINSLFGIPFLFLRNASKTVWRNYSEMTPSPTRNKKKTKEKNQKPEIFLQREIFSKLMEKGKTLKDIYGQLQESSTGKAPTIRTLRNWRKKWENNQFTISDGRAGRVRVSPRVYARTASLFKKSGYNSIRQFSRRFL